jgi:glycosyltransferase involved in cell wall biosynthesis
MKTKNIKIITYQNFPYGGASANFVRYFALALAKDGNKVEVIKPTGQTYGRKIEDKPKRVGRIENVRYRLIGFLIHPSSFFGKVLSSFWSLFYTQFFLFISNIKSSFDTIICYNTHYFRILFLIIFKYIFQKKMIIILPEFYEKPKTNILSIFKWYEFYFGLKYLSKFADGYITVSHYMSNYLKDTLKIKKPIYILPNIMDPQAFSSNDIKPFIKNKITIGYAGTPTKKDGVIDLIKSFSVLNKKYPNTHLLIVGDEIGNHSVLPKLKKIITEKKLEECITLTGLVPFSNIPKLLHSCQILALTRPTGVFAKAGFPTKLGEYFACKKPVLVTSVGDIPFYFKNKKHVIISKPENIDSIVNGFEEIINNTNLAIKMSNNSYEWMDENLNYNNVSKKLSNYIKSI